MIPKEACVDIWSLARQGFSERQIAKKVGLHRLTVKRYLESGEMPNYRKVVRKSQMEPYQQLIKDWLVQNDYLATKIHELLIAQGYTGAYDAVQRYVKTVKEERDRIAYVRFETVPGQQAQVDFGEFAIVSENGTEKTLYCFVMLLGFSRHMYVEFVERCTMPVFLDCHKNAFGYFGGVPGELLYDNMKNVVIRNLVGKVTFNERMLDFAGHYQYKPMACPAYSPWCKGKVERPMDYIRERFWRGYVFWTREKANKDALNWLNMVAMERIHGTTKQKVSERFAAERKYLGSIPQRPYDTAEKYIRKVQKDCLISFGANLYGIPHKCVGKKVVVKAQNGIMRAYYDDELLVTYRLVTGKGQMIVHPWIYEALRNDQEQLRKKYRKAPGGKGKATTIGLLKHDNYKVEIRDLAVYENAAGFSQSRESGAGGAQCPN